MKLGTTLKKPVITEKTAKMESEGKYCFKVKMTATKGSVADQLKQEFGVDVVDVRTMVMPGKPKRIKGTNRFSQRKKFKKAIVTLREGQSLSDFSGGSK